MRKVTIDISRDPNVELGTEIPHRLPPLRALTSLRFFAATYVAIYHLAAGRSLFKWAVVENFVASGDTGVSLFFVLSGFILAYNYRTVDKPRAFWISRFARVYPVYLFALLTGVAYSFAPASASQAHAWVRFLLTATLLQSWYQPFADSFNSPGWTLSVEAFFYAVFPMATGLLARLNRRASVLLCLGYIACLCAPIEMLAEGRGGQAVALSGWLTASKFPLLYLPLFLIGSWLGMRYRRKRGQVTETGQFQTPRSRYLQYLAAAGSVALLCAGPLGVFEPLRRGLLSLCYAALIYGLAEVRGGPLTSRWMVLAGEISFSIYILQMPVFRTVFGLIRHMHLKSVTNILLALCALIAAACIAYRFIELPARIAIRQWLTHKPVPLRKIQ